MEVSIIVLATQRKFSPSRASRRWRRWAASGLCGGLALAGIATAQAAWTPIIQPDPITRQSRCLLISEPAITPDGYDSTSVQLVFNGDHLLVVTDSEIDASFTDLQLLVDDKPPIRGDQLARKKMILVIDQDIPDLVQQLRAGRQVTVYLRFWPTWPATERFAIPFSLVGFSRAHDGFNQGCRPVN
jgi:hypothetical protein